MSSFLLPTSNAAHFHILRVFHQAKQWIGEAENIEAEDYEKKR
jgi:cupin superfamily acireductone dioxygenase involved in methionine salvage